MQKEFVLPEMVIKASTQSPENLIIYSKPKAGKTTMLSKLEGCLIIDLEQGSNKVDALKVQADSLKELAQWIQVIKKKNADVNGYAYKYIAVDTVTELEAWCEQDATAMYMQTPMGKNFNRSDSKIDSRTGDAMVLPRSQWESVLTLPKGAGYLYLRNSFKKWMNLLMELAPHVIFIAHVKDGSADKKGKEVATKDLDLTGKLKTIVAQKADAIGYVHWEGEDLMISFESREGIEASSRCEHLKNTTIPFEWDRIFID